MSRGTWGGATSSSATKRCARTQLHRVLSAPEGARFAGAGKGICTAGHAAGHTLSDEPSAMPSSFGVHAMQCSVLLLMMMFIAIFAGD